MSLPKDVEEMLGYHGCLSGDCPHEKQVECFRSVTEDTVTLCESRAKELAEALDIVTKATQSYAESGCIEAYVFDERPNEKCLSDIVEEARIALKNWNQGRE
jgi:hypothetical protein